MTIIKNGLKILTKTELELFENTQEYIRTLKEQAELEARFIIEEARLIKENAYQQVLEKFQKENIEFIKLSEQKLEDYFNDVASRMAKIVYDVLLRFGIGNLQLDSIFTIIRNEVFNNDNFENITIIANELEIEQLKNRFNIKNGLNFQVDSSLGVGDFICDIGFYIFRVNLEYIEEEIKKICHL